MNVISRSLKFQSLVALFKENRRLVGVLGLFSIMPLLFSSALGSWLLVNRSLVSELMPEWGLMFIILSCVPMAVGLAPTTFVALISGFFMGMEGATFLVLAYILASAFGYGLGRLLDGGRFLKSLLQYHVASRVAEDLRTKSVTMVVLVRLSPALPFCLMNLLLAALRVNFVTYLLAGTAGMLPRTLLFLWVGSQSRDLVDLLEKGAGQLETVLVIAGSMLTVGLLVWMVSWRVRKYLAV